MADAVVAETTQVDSTGRRRLDNQAVAYRLGRAFARIEAAQSTPGIFGRVAIAHTMRDVAGVDGCFSGPPRR